MPVLTSTPGPPTRAGWVTADGGVVVEDGAAATEEATGAPLGELPELPLVLADGPGVLGPPSQAAAKLPAAVSTTTLVPGLGKTISKVSLVVQALPGAF